MKHKFALIIIISALLIAVALNAVLYLIMPERFLASPAFSIVWIFTFPVNLLLTGASTLYVSVKNKDSAVRFPPVMSICCLFSILYFAVGCKLMTIPFLTANVPLAVEIVITTLYVIFLLSVFFGVGYIETVQGYTKKKVQYIGLLEADVKSTLSYVTNPQTRSDLEALAEKIRFSDPMSHESLAGCETEISRAVSNIVSAVRTDPDADVSGDIAKIRTLLDYRNDRCRLLK